MMLTYKYKDNTLREIKLGDITNVVGQDFCSIDYFIEHFVDYFSKYKFSTTDENMYDFNIFFKVDNEEVSRNFFDVCYIDSSTINTHLLFNKDSLIYNYCESVLNDLKISHSMTKIYDEIENIAVEISKLLPETIKDYVEVSGKEVTESIVLKHFIEMTTTRENLSLKYISNAEKLELIMNLVIESSVRDNNTKVVVIKNIDSLLSKEEFIKFNNKIQQVTKNYNIKFLVSSKKSQYLVGGIDDVEFVTVMSDIILNIPDINFFTDFINRNYPTSEVFTEVQVYNVLKRISTILLSKNVALEYTKDFVFVKLVNQCYGIETCKMGVNISECELNFLTD